MSYVQDWYIKGADIPRKQAFCLLAYEKTYKSKRNREQSISLTLVSFCASKQAKCLHFEVCLHLKVSREIWPKNNSTHHSCGPMLAFYAA